MAVLVTPQVKRNTKQLRIKNRQHKLQQPFQSQKLHQSLRQNRLQSLRQHQFQLDGTTITTNCQVDGIVYSKYIYHPAIPESSNVEIVTTYENQIVDYKTQCNDGTWSPSNAKGKGACSHHGGVYDFYAPVYRSVRVDTEQTVIDPAVDAWYETEVKK